MRGSPLLHCLIACLGFALFAVPLARLTSAPRHAAPAAAPEPAATAATAPRPTLVRLRFAHPPTKLVLRQGDTVLVSLPSPAPTPPFESTIQLAILRDGLELILEGAWPEGTPATAVTVELEPDEMESRQATAWTEGVTLNRILNFAW